MGKAIDITGQKFNHWTVIERAANNSRGDAQWLCECDCENHTQAVVLGTNLRNGHSTSCGCAKKKAAAKVGHNNSKNLVGQIFGRLEVLEKSYSKNYKVYWKCRCLNDGNICEVSTDHLISGHTKSCGCLQKETASYDLIGKKFGFLEVIAKTDKRNSSGNIIWRCRCLRDGNECEVPGVRLTNGETKSCGCLTSFGEAKIIDILQQNNILYEREKSFVDFVNDNGNKYRYDFYLPNYNRLIEFDGIQHYSYRNSETSWNNQMNFEKTQESDRLKNQYALSHNIDLVRIPYWEKDNITLDMILGDKYLVK